MERIEELLKHKRKEMRLEDLIVRLRIEEDNRASEKKAGKAIMESKANVVEQGQTSHNNKKRKHNDNGPKQGPTKKFQGKCYVCSKQGPVLRTVIVARNKGIQRRNALKPM